MKQTLTLVAAGWLALSGALAASDDTAPKAVIAAASHDFGPVKQGTRVTHAFVVKNAGSAPLRIAGVELSFPEMRARFKPEIAPGAEGTITVEWSTEKLHGEVEAQGIVALNDPALPKATLVLKVTAEPPIAILPMPMVYMSVFAGEGGERTLTVKNNEPAALDVTRLEPQGTHFTAVLVPETPGRLYRVSVKVAKETPPGRYEEAFVLHTDSPAHPRIRVPVNVFVKGDLYATPETVDFGSVPLGDLRANPGLLSLLTQTFLVKQRQGSFEIASVTADVPGVVVTRDPASGSSDTFRVDVKLSREALTPRKLDGTIRIKAKDPKVPEIVVPVRGELRP